MKFMPSKKIQSNERYSKLIKLYVIKSNQNKTKQTVSQENLDVNKIGFSTRDE